MKTLKDLNAQQMSKSQMNHVRGGGLPEGCDYTCTLNLDGIVMTGPACGQSAADVAIDLGILYQEFYDNVQVDCSHNSVL